MSKRRSVAAVAAFVALLGACGEDDGEDASSGGNGGGETPKLVAAEFEWDPSTLTVSSGEPIEVVNEDEVEHNLTIEETDVDQDVAGGETVTVDLGDLEPGSHDFVCEYHPDTMTGTLDVE